MSLYTTIMSSIRDVLGLRRTHSLTYLLIGMTETTEAAQVTVTDGESAQKVETQTMRERTRRFGPRSDAIQVLEGIDLSGRTILITGTTSGIGIETARSLVLHGAHVVMANRNLVESENQKKTLLQEKPDAKIDIIMCDLSSLQSVQAAAKEFRAKQWPLHVLILNAGVFHPTQKTTIDGYESSFGVNHLAHFYLIRELLPVLRQSQPSRIVIVSSTSHAHSGINVNASIDEKVGRLIQKGEGDVIGYKLYALSKLCNILTAFRLHRTESEHNIGVYVLHPGTMIGTNISRGFGAFGRFFNVLSRPFTKTLSQGAATTVYCGASSEIADISGKYWESCWDDEKSLQADLARDEALQEALWQRSEALIKEFEDSRRPPAATTN